MRRGAHWGSCAHTRGAPEKNRIGGALIMDGRMTQKKPERWAREKNAFSASSARPVLHTFARPARFRLSDLFMFDFLFSYSARARASIYVRVCADESNCVHRLQFKTISLVSALAVFSFFSSYYLEIGSLLDYRVRFLNCLILQSGCGFGIWNTYLGV